MAGPATKYFKFRSSLAFKPIVDRMGDKLLRAARRSPGTVFALHLSKSPWETKKTAILSLNEEFLSQFTANNLNQVRILIYYWQEDSSKAACFCIFTLQNYFM